MCLGGITGAPLCLFCLLFRQHVASHYRYHLMMSILQKDYEMQEGDVRTLIQGRITLFKYLGFSPSFSKAKLKRPDQPCGPEQDTIPKSLLIFTF